MSGNKTGKAGYSTEEKKAASVLLKNLAVDFEEKLYSVKIQLKSHISLLQEKEYELAERERIKVHNRDLFSPIYNKSNDTKEILSSIDQIKKQIDELTTEQANLADKVNGLKTAAQSLDFFLQDLDSDDNDYEKMTLGGEYGLSILEAQEIERQRIARDLHDTTVQNLTSMVHKSELCIKLIDIDTLRAKLELNTMSNTIKSVINDMRDIIYNLKPMTLDDLGLTITVERYANRLMDLNNIEVRVLANEEVKEILPVIKLTLFSIINEACCNVIKHASASLIDINIHYEEHNVKLIIKDDGVGFNVKKLQVNNSEQASSFGLSMIKERISLLSGTLDIKSEKGKGTIITVSVPLTIYEEDNYEQTN